jgi:outer membrane protein assembly factor BamB
LYIGSKDNRLWAFNANGTTSRYWQTQGIVQGSPALGADGTIYVGSADGNLYAFNPDGTTQHVWQTEGEVYSSPAIGLDGTIYVGSYDGDFYAFNPDGTTQHVWETTGGIDSSPAIGGDGTIYVGSHTVGIGSSANALYAFNPDGTTQQVWSVPGNIFYSSPAIGSDGVVYVGSVDPGGTNGSLYAFNQDGSTGHVWNGGGGFISSPVIGTNGVIYIGRADGAVIAFNPNGATQQVWSVPVSSFYLLASPTVGSDGTLYIGANGNRFYALNPNGTTALVYNVGEWIYSGSALDTNGTVYVGCRDSKVYAFAGTGGGLASSPWPKFRGDARNTGRTPLLAPTNVIAGKGLTSRHVTIAWAGLANAIGYEVWRSALPSMAQAVPIAQTADTSLVDDIGSPSTPYYYWVKARYAMGNSCLSGGAPYINWSESDAVAPPGEGTEASPFLISQLGHLVWMGDTVAMSGGTYYTLQNDLDASDTTNWNSGAGFAPIGIDSAPFMGCFDGNGKTISGLTVNRPGQSFTGFIGFSGVSSEVKNLGLSGGSMTGASYVGSLAGYNAGLITGCHATGPVTGGSSVGGLVGLNQYGTLSNCYATGSVNGSGNYAGGLAGGNDQSGGIVIECYATGEVTGNTYVGGLVGANSNGARVDHSYAVGSVAGSVSVGGLVGYNNSEVTDSYWDTTTTGLADSAGGAGRTTDEMMKQSTYVGWDFTTVWRMTESVTYPSFGVAALPPAGAGTEEDPYQISQLAHLVWVGEHVDESIGRYYLMQNDIDASAAAFWNNGAGLAPIGHGATVGFMGVFDGNGKTISNLTINRPDQTEVGLFGYVENSGVVKNLGLAGGTVTGAGYTGALVGWNRGTLSGCHASVAVRGTYNVGGLVGINQNVGTVSVCHATGVVKGNNYTGGLVGENAGGTVDRCYATGAVIGPDRSGGLAGGSYGTVSACYAMGAVKGHNTVGGLLGNNYGIVSDCYARGPVTASFYAGGLVGVAGAGGTVDSSYWDTNATGQALSVGGTGKTTAEMKQQATFEGWDFVNVWHITEGVTYPLLTEPLRTIGVSGNLAFGNVTMGTTATAAMTITNSGNATLTVTGIRTPVGFSAEWGGTIPAGGSHVVQVTFSPVAAQGYGGTVTVDSDKTLGGNTISASGTGVAAPSRGQICLSASTYTAQEGVKRKILVKRINGSNGTVSVTYTLKPKTALAGKDYTPVTGTLTWTNGQTAAKTIKLVIRVDGKVEGNEVFQILLKNPVGATLASPFKANITILGNSKGIDAE